MKNTGLIDVMLCCSQPMCITKSRASPFLKWAGGKRSILPEIHAHLPPDIRHYYEPFLGGGAVFFAFEHRIESAFLSDINPELMLTYRVVQTAVDALIEILKIHKEKHNPDYYKHIREQHNIKDPIQLAARFIYLNKTCFNGLYRVNSTGRFNVPIGRYTNPNICDESNLHSGADVLKKATLTFGHFEKISPNPNDFIYCDPPYHGTFTDYIPGGFDDQNQKDLKSCADLWRQKGAHVMLSNSDTPFIRKLYKDYNIFEVSAPRHINCKAESREFSLELLITSY